MQAVAAEVDMPTVMLAAEQCRDDEEATGEEETGQKHQ
jgi:hypothetical protein